MPFSFPSAARLPMYWTIWCDPDPFAGSRRGGRTVDVCLVGDETPGWDAALNDAVVVLWVYPIWFRGSVVVRCKQQKLLFWHRSASVASCLGASEPA